MIIAETGERRRTKRRAGTVRMCAAVFAIAAGLLFAAAPARAEAPAPAAASAPPAAAFDPVAATEAYLARITPEARARSDAYFEGGYWLQLADLLCALAIAGLLLETRLSARMRDVAVRLVRFRPLQTVLYWAEYLVLTSILAFPLDVYTGFVRERAYGLGTQTFGGWLGDECKNLAIGLVLGGLAMAMLYGVLRRASRAWPLWGAGVAVLFLAVAFVIGPVFIAPLFNTYTKLQDKAVRDPILSLARANGIPATEVYEVDASRQSTRISANVSGLFGTERITLNDNLLERCTLPEIEAAMGHEMGHYVLNHPQKFILEFGVVIVVGFVFLRFGFERLARRRGGRWGVTGLGDPAGLPLLVALLTAYFFLMTPVVNTIIRTAESEADAFGLNASGQPDGFALVSLKLADYRKLSPGPLEEMIFFNHPSGRARILRAMRWKAEHLHP